MRNAETRADAIRPYKIGEAKVIRECTVDDAERICAVVNEAAEAYRGVIPDDCWHEPYMPLDELRREMASMRFFGWEENDGQDAHPTRNPTEEGGQDARLTRNGMKEGGLVGVMGYQSFRGRITLVRHAYVLSTRQGEGIGGKLLAHVTSMPSGRLLVGTWKAATWAVRFYESHGFRRLGDEESQELLRRYWEIPARQRETSLVLELGV